jgi:TPR repeat protein
MVPRVFLKVPVAALLVVNISECSSGDDKKEIRTALQQWRADETKIRTRWEDDEEYGWRKLPPRAWPPIQPDTDALETLQSAAEMCSDPSKKQCQTGLFDLASCLVFNSIDADAALNHYQELAKVGHVDSMVAAGILLTEGFGVDIDIIQGTNYLVSAVNSNSAQACYELGSGIYNGTIEEYPLLSTSGRVQSMRKVQDADKEAFELYIRAATQISEDNNNNNNSGHVGAAFMAGDMLLEGEGCPKNVSAAIPLLMYAAENGHRYGRQRIRQLLDDTAVKQ